MAAAETLYPFEIIIEGVPVSHQAANSASRERWRNTVAEAARIRQRETYELGLLDRRPLAVTIYYFPSVPMSGDVDNIVKLIIDGLTSIAYIDDQDVQRVTVQKFEPEEDWEFSAPSSNLAAALDREAPVLYIRVDDDLSWRRL